MIHDPQHTLTRVEVTVPAQLRRMLNYYLSGAKPIPKTVWLACLGWEVEQGHRKAA